jgi:hypothetical protein
MKIIRPAELQLMALGLPATPANFGDGFKAQRSDQSASTTNTTTNTTTNVTDRRFVNDGGGAGVSGDNNTTFNSVTQTDLGAVAGAMDLAKTSVQLSHDNMTSAVGLADQTFNKSVDANSTMFGINASNMLSGFAKLIDASNTVMQTAKDVNQTATQDVAQAWQAQATTSNGQKFMVAGGLVLAGIVAIAALRDHRA